jgi:hypothetical protein
VCQLVSQGRKKNLNHSEPRTRGLCEINTPSVKTWILFSPTTFPFSVAMDSIEYLPLQWEYELLVEDMGMKKMAILYEKKKWRIV